MKGGKKSEELRGLRRWWQTLIEFLRSMGDHYALGWLDKRWSVVVVGNPVMGGYTINYVRAFVLALILFLALRVFSFPTESITFALVSLAVFPFVMNSIFGEDKHMVLK